MLTEKIDLYGDHRVMLYTYHANWTTVPGHYPDRAGVLVLPGGAYMTHAASEGEPVAMAFAGAGCNAYLLRYSIGEHAAFPAPVADVCRALAIIRSNAAAWHQNPDQLAVCGFSAGGHAAACTGTMWNRRDVLEASGCTGEEGKPNALILCYPCITVDIAGQGDMYSRLLGDEAKTLEELHALASAEKWVGPHTPPVFLWNGWHDRLVAVEHSLLLMNALAEKDIPYECHTYMNGAHATALNTPVTSLGAAVRENAHAARWFDDCLAWLSELFGAPALDVEQEEMQSIAENRAHFGIPAI